MEIAKSLEVLVGKVRLGNNLPFVLIAGPCQIESRSHAIEVADAINTICRKFDQPFIYKSSFDKANRTSISSQRGIGFKKGLPILAEVRERLGCPVLTDVHDPNQCKTTAEAVDVLHIPAFLCRQTDLLIAAGKTGKCVNVKKGQYMAPWDMKNVVKKLESVSNLNILLTERGASFGYNTLISDMRALPIMGETGYPIIFDATHSVQQPGALDGKTGGERRYVPVWPARL